MPSILLFDFNLLILKPYGFKDFERYCVNKNTLFAFVLIAITVIFFNSSFWNEFWYGTILKKPVPTVQAPPRQTKTAASEQQGGRDSADIRVIPPEEKIASAASQDGGSPVSAPIDSADAAGDSTAAVQIAEDTVIVETNRLIAAVSTKGGRIVSLKMKDYLYVTGPHREDMIDLIPNTKDGVAGGAQLSINNESFDDRFFTVVSAVEIKADTNNADDKNISNNINTTDNNVNTTTNTIDTNSASGASVKYAQNPVTVTADGYDLILETQSAAGKSIQKVFSFSDGTYKIGYTVRGGGVAGQKITLGWKSGIEDSEAAHDIPFGGNIDNRRAHYSNGKRVDHFEMKKKGSEAPSGEFRWVGVSSKYFFLAIVADTVSEADIRVEGRDVSVRRDKKEPPEIDYSIYYQSEARSDTVAGWLYAGPGRIGELSRHGLKFEKTLFPVLSWARYILWADVWFPPLAEIILWVLLFLYGLVKDYAIAIALLTLLSKIVTYPMTQSSMKSMAKMKEIGPKINALRQKYKSNPQKMNVEMMALYKAEGVNPFNPGCLPMFLQMPIFVALFVVLRKAIELRGATSFLLPWVKDLSLPEALFTLPFALPIYGSNVGLMPIVMAALTFFQQKQAIQDPNQKAMIYMMPVIMLVMFNGFPAGVVFYWTMSSAFSLAQQKWLPPKLTPSPAAAAVASGPGSGAHHKAPVKKKSPGGGSSSSGGKRKNKR